MANYFCTDSVEEQVDYLTDKVTDLNTKKLDKAAVVQATGTGTDVVMSQKSVTDVINNNLQTVNESLQTINTEISGKLTKPTNPSAESAVTMLSDGTVGTKPLSEIGGSGDLNLENGTGTGSLVQKRVNTKGEWVTTKAYQGASTAFGGGTQAGRTEDEFNAYFYDSVHNKPINGGAGKNSSGEILDNRSLTYKKSYSFGVAEGEQTKALGRGSHSEGYYTKTEGDYSHVEGWKTFSKGLASHAEGEQTTASGDFSHAEGFGTTSKGACSHAEGMSTEAIGEKSHVEGFATRALIEFQHVEGVYNADNPNALHIVGNGTSDNARKNAFEVLKDGTIRVPNFNSSGNTIGMATLKVVNGKLTVIV